MGLISIKTRLKRILKAIGDPDAKVHYNYYVVKGYESGKILLMCVQKKRGDKYIESINQGHPEYKKAVEQYKREEGLEELVVNGIKY